MLVSKADLYDLLTAYVFPASSDTFIHLYSTLRTFQTKLVAAASLEDFMAYLALRSFQYS